MGAFRGESEGGGEGGDGWEASSCAATSLLAEALAFERYVFQPVVQKTRGTTVSIDMSGRPKVRHYVRPVSVSIEDTRYVPSPTPCKNKPRCCGGMTE